jgi:hypothetical protein
MTSVTDALLATTVIALASAGCGGGGSSSAGESPSSAPTAAATPTTDAAPPASTAPAAAEGPLAAVAWLVGSWTATTPDGATVEETWSAPAGNSMTGSGKTTAGGAVKSSEDLKIEARDGALVYVAKPGGAPAPTEFKHDTRVSSATVAMFVNEENEWPTRIRYELVGGEIKVKVSGRPGQSVETWTLKKK